MQGGRRPYGPRVVVSPFRAMKYEVSVTGLVFESPVLHVEQPETEDRGVSSFLNLFGVPQDSAQLLSQEEVCLMMLTVVLRISS